MAINTQGADRYFATRTLNSAWKEFSAEQRECAIEQAKRDLSRALRRPMREDEKPYQYGDAVRDEFAVYEQALFTLLRDANPNGAGSDIPSLEPDEKQGHAYTLKSGHSKWSEEALAWLGGSSHVGVVLG